MVSLLQGVAFAVPIFCFPGPWLMRVPLLRATCSCVLVPASSPPVKPAAHRCVGGVPCHREAASTELGTRWVIDTLHWHKVGLWCLSPPREIAGGTRLHQFCPEPSVLLRHLLHTLSYQHLYSHRLVQCTPLGGSVEKTDI